jgi:acyl-CoA thioester hydrolase
LKGASILMDQTILRDGGTLFRAKVTLVCLNDAGRAQRMPDAVRAALTL